jgi:3-methylfumaryl-CoA hydratase
MPSPALDIDLLKQWIGRRESGRDLVHASHANALAATLDRDEQFSDGDPLPPLWHWVYFWSTTRASDVGADGHARRGGFLPPVPLPRRMWAGGRLRFVAPLPVGEVAEKTSTILDVSIKEGATGPLAFVTVEHTVSSGGTACIIEEHDIVYRDHAAAGAPAPKGKPAPTDAHWTRRIEPDPVLLFRYSALTFNGHRIHYDRSYVTGVEGYPGLIVHGPLIATMLMDLLRREHPQRAVTVFSFRAVSPLFDIDSFTVNGKLADDGRTATLWAANARGELAMQAEATLD